MKGCSYRGTKAGSWTCGKVVDAGQTLCPHHILVVEHEKQQTIAAEKKKRLELETRNKSRAFANR